MSDIEPIYTCKTKRGSVLKAFITATEEEVNEDSKTFANYIEEEYGSMLGINMPIKTVNMQNSAFLKYMVRVTMDDECIGFFYFSKELEFDKRDIPVRVIGSIAVWMDTTKTQSMFLMLVMDRYVHESMVIAFGPSENVWKRFYSWCTDDSIAALTQNPSEPLIIDRQNSRKKVARVSEILIEPYSCSGEFYRRRGFPAEWDKTAKAKELKRYKKDINNG
jgi:hypothetical protein